jgi:hypothetical protein
MVVQKEPEKGRVVSVAGVPSAIPQSTTIRSTPTANIIETPPKPITPTLKRVRITKERGDLTRSGYIYKAMTNLGEKASQLNYNVIQRGPRGEEVIQKVTNKQTTPEGGISGTVPELVYPTVPSKIQDNNAQLRAPKVYIKWEEQQIGEDAYAKGRSPGYFAPPRALPEHLPPVTPPVTLPVLLEVKNIRATELRPDFARLEWDGVRMPGIAYKVWLDGVAQGTAVTEPRIEFSGLKPGRRYKVEIRTQPYSRMSRQAPSKKVTYYFTTPPQVPPGVETPPLPSPVTPPVKPERTVTRPPTRERKVSKRVEELMKKRAFPKAVKEAIEKGLEEKEAPRDIERIIEKVARTNEPDYILRRTIAKRIGVQGIVQYKVDTDKGTIVYENADENTVNAILGMSTPTGAPVPEAGKVRITTNPVGARVYTKRLGDYIYAGLSPQTLTLPASAVPVLVKVTKPEFADVHDIVYLVSNETIEKVYAMERIAIDEPEEATTTLKVMSHPGAEVFLYMEGAEGFISYGRTPQTLTLKARTGAWVPMDEAKRALSETRLSPIEADRVQNEDAKRTAMVVAALENYDTAKEERKEVEETLKGFRESYNLFQTSFNVFFTGYSTFITDYTSLQSEITTFKREILELEGMESLDEWEEDYLESCKELLASIEGQLAQLQPMKNELEVEKAQWDADRQYWSDILLEYEQRRQICREYEDQMKAEFEEAKLRARSPFWLPTPGMKGVMWHLKIEEPGYRTEVDEFILEPGRPMTKDYAIVRILDITTPESLAPLIINTPPPKPPDIPFAYAWLFIIPWPEGHVYVLDVATRGLMCGYNQKCSMTFLKVKPGRRTYKIWRRYYQPIVLTLDIAPGETRYVQVDVIPLTEAQKAAKRAAQAAGGDWLACGSGASSRSRFEATKAAGKVS